VGVFIHGRARVVRGGPGEADELRPIWTEIYHSSPEDWVSTPIDARYIEIVASCMFSYAFSRERFEAMSEPGGESRSEDQRFHNS
jgi:hypothetical protein